MIPATKRTQERVSLKQLFSLQKSAESKHSIPQNRDISCGHQKTVFRCFIPVCFLRLLLCVYFHCLIITRFECYEKNITFLKGMWISWNVLFFSNRDFLVNKTRFFLWALGTSCWSFWSRSASSLVFWVGNVPFSSNKFEHAQILSMQRYYKKHNIFISKSIFIIYFIFYICANL